jgi:hypothetical protein
MTLKKRGKRSNSPKMQGQTQQQLGQEYLKRAKMKITIHNVRIDWKNKKKSKNSITTRSQT